MVNLEFPLTVVFSDKRLLYEKNIVDTNSKFEQANLWADI